MRAVNLVPEDARRGRGGSGSGLSQISAAAFGPAQLVVGALLIVIALIGLRVLADNHVNNTRATLGALQSEVVSEQAKASQLNTYKSFIEAAQQREDQVREIAEQRFAWQRTLDQLSRVMPATTSLTSLSATVLGSSTSGSGTTGTTGDGPTFSLAGCASTPNANGVATLLRRLRLLSGVTSVGFENSTRAGCGNSFNLTLGFAVPTVAGAAGSSSMADVQTSATTAATAPSNSSATQATVG